MPASDRQPPLVSAMRLGGAMLGGCLFLWMTVHAYVGWRLVGNTTAALEMLRHMPPRVECTVPSDPPTRGKQRPAPPDAPDIF